MYYLHLAQVDSVAQSLKLVKLGVTRVLLLYIVQIYYRFSQGCAGGDPRAATVLYAHQGHPASPATPCHHQPNASSRASLNSPRNQRPAVCPPAHPLLLLKIRGTWNLGPHWEGNLEDQYWLVEPSAPSPTEGPGTVTTSLPSCQ